MHIISNLGIEHTVSTATTLNGASLVRIYNNNGSDVLVSLTDGNSVTFATITVKAGTVEYLSKNPGDYLVCASS